MTAWTKHRGLSFRCVQLGGFVFIGKTTSRILPQLAASRWQLSTSKFTGWVLSYPLRFFIGKTRASPSSKSDCFVWQKPGLILPYLRCLSSTIQQNQQRFSRLSFLFTRDKSLLEDRESASDNSCLLSLPGRNVKQHSWEILMSQCSSKPRSKNFKSTLFNAGFIYYGSWRTIVPVMI